MDTIIKRISDFIIEKSMLRDGDRVLLSLSAGKDSMMLLHVMSALCIKYNLELAVFHLNHCMRGVESDLDEDHVRKSASDHDIPFHIERFDFREKKLPGRSFEDYARDVRYSMLQRIASEHGYNRIATAHSADDQVETVLMRIFTGTGIYGLRGIQTVRDSIIRPLLEVSSSEIYQYLRLNGIIWREDSSNADTGYSRNFIRHEIIPAIRKRFPVDRSIAYLAEHAGEAVDLLDRLIDAETGLLIFEDSFFIIEYDYIKNDFPLLKHLLSRYMREQGHRPLTERVFYEIDKNLRSEHFNVTLFSSGSLIIERIKYKGRGVIRAGTKESDVNEISKNYWQYVLKIENLPLNIHIPELDLDLVLNEVNGNFFSSEKGSETCIFFEVPTQVDSVVVRNRRDGDRILLESGSKKIKDYMIEKKYDRHLRDSIPLLIIEGQVAAVMPGMLGLKGNRTARGFQIREDSEKIFALYSPGALY